MSSMTTQIVQNETTAVTRARTAGTCVHPTATMLSAAGGMAPGYRDANGTGLNRTRDFATAGNWSLAIRIPMPKVDFHDRWPLRTTL